MRAPAVPKAIVFDLDGTLVDSAPDIAWAINRLLAGYSLPPQSVHAIERLTGEGAQALVAKVYASLGIDVDAARVAHDTAVYLEQYGTRPCADSTLFADAATALPALRRAGIKLALCTNKPEALAVLVLRAFGLLDGMEAVVGADTTAERKPHPLPLLHTLRAIGVSPSDALYVGDTVIDRECAAAAGVACLIVDWSVSAAVGLPASERLARFADLLPAVPDATGRDPAG